MVDEYLDLVYSSLIRSVLEYASPVWTNLPDYLSLFIEGVRKKAMKITFPGLPREDALERCGLASLSDRRDPACIGVLAVVVAAALKLFLTDTTSDQALFDKSMSLPYQAATVLGDVAFAVFISLE